MPQKHRDRWPKDQVVVVSVHFGIIAIGLTIAVVAPRVIALVAG